MYSCLDFTFDINAKSLSVKGNLVHFLNLDLTNRFHVKACLFSYSGSQMMSKCCKNKEVASGGFPCSDDKQ